MTTATVATMPTGLAGVWLATARVFLFFLWAVVSLPLCGVTKLIGSNSAAMRVVVYRGLCWIMGLDVVVHGQPAASRPLLIASNHISYLDIVVFGAVAELEFVSKAEVANWPVIGALAKLGDTVFIDRRRSQTIAAKEDIAARLGANRTVVFFPEATSGDGNHLLPFKSALFTVADAIGGDGAVTVQPAAIAYTRLNGLPTGLGWRAFFAWYGDMSLLGHLWRFLQLGRTTVEVAFLPPIIQTGTGDRKALAAATETAVRDGFTRLVSGQTPEI